LWRYTLGPLPLSDSGWNFEEAFRLSACNYEPEGLGERARENPKIVEQLALTGRICLAAHAVTLKISVGPNMATLW
jgi:hypothetical protein